MSLSIKEILAFATLALLTSAPVHAGKDRDAAVAAAWARLRNQEPCCAQFSELDFGNTVTARIQSIPLELNRTRLFGSERAAFVGLTLPGMVSPYYVQVGSGIKTITRMGGMGSAYFFDPSVIFLDTDFNEVRRVDVFGCKFADSGIAPKGEGGYFGAIKVDPARERYILILANPAGEGRSIDFSFTNRYPFAFQGMTADWQVPFGPDGVVEIRIAAENMPGRLRAKTTCKVVD